MTFRTSIFSDVFILLGAIGLTVYLIYRNRKERVAFLQFMFVGIASFVVWMFVAGLVGEVYISDSRITWRTQNLLFFTEHRFLVLDEIAAVQLNAAPPWYRRRDSAGSRWRFRMRTGEIVVPSMSPAWGQNRSEILAILTARGITVETFKD
ncbi:MAG: hypothetical protein ACRCV9_18840 [Burkholderiaceae bacterium]